jgi:hypothetical protein
MGEFTRSPLNLAAYPAGIQAVLQETVADFWDDYLKNQVNAKLILPFTLSQAELALLNELTAPLIVDNPNFARDEKRVAFAGNYKLEVASLRHPEHAVARALATVGDFILRKKVERIDPATVCEIGPAPARIPTMRHHGCSVIDGRDYSRITSALAAHPKNTTLRKALAGQSSDKWCLDGVHKCKKQHLVGIASDSIYDITPSQMVETMFAKNMHIVYATLWAPAQISAPSGDYENDIFHIQIKDGRVCMDFKDTAFAYEHDQKTWSTWAFSAGYHDRKKGRGILIETQQSWGPFKMIQITRAEGNIKALRTIPSNSLLVGIPNFRYCIASILECRLTNRFWRSPKKARADRIRKIKTIVTNAPKIFVPKDLYSKMLQFCMNRKDSDFDRNVVGSAISAKSQKIEIDAYTIQRGIQMSGADHRDLSTAMTLIGMACRQTQTQIIAKMANLYRDGPEENKIMQSLLLMIFGRSFNTPALTEAARVISGDGALVDFIANCVNEEPEREFSRVEFKAKHGGKLVKSFTGNGGFGMIRGCKCVRPSRKWLSVSSAFCSHGHIYTSGHVKIVPITPVNVSQNYRHVTNLEKSASVVKIFRDTINNKAIFNACAAPGNDGSIGFAVSNHSSEYLTRTQPNGKWFLDGNVHCHQCMNAMSKDISNHYFDYGSPCSSQYFDPRLLGKKWQKNNKYIVKVQKGLEMLQENEFPARYLGHYIAPVECNGAEICIANFQGDESWPQIEFDHSQNLNNEFGDVTPDLPPELEPEIPPEISFFERLLGTKPEAKPENKAAPLESADSEAYWTGTSQTEDVNTPVTDAEAETTVPQTTPDVAPSAPPMPTPKPKAEDSDDIQSAPIQVQAEVHCEPSEDDEPIDAEFASPPEGYEDENDPDEPIDAEFASPPGDADEEIDFESEDATRPEPAQEDDAIIETMIGPPDAFADKSNANETVETEEVSFGKPVFTTGPSLETQQDEVTEQEATDLPKSIKFSEPTEEEIAPAEKLQLSAEELLALPDEEKTDLSGDCGHSFPETRGCSSCLPSLEVADYHGNLGSEWFNPNTATECFASALLARDATRHETMLEVCIASIEDEERMQAFRDSSRYDFLTEAVLALLAKAMERRIIIDYVDQKRKASFGIGLPIYLRLRDNHFIRMHSPCKECAKVEEFQCTEKHDPKWVDVSIPSFDIANDTRKVIARELTAEAKFKKFHSPILKYLPEKIPDMKVKTIIGKAGSGKTYTAMRMLAKVDDLIVVVPTKALRDEYKAKYKRKGMRVQVWSEFCADPTFTSCILIDEVFMQHPIVVAIAASHAENLYAIGDPEQNQYGGKKTVRVMPQITDALSKAEVQIKCSRSVPLDVCKFLYAYDIKLKTHSSVTHSIFPVTSGRPKKFKNGMCFTNETEEHGDFKTVNKMQGARFARGLIYLDKGFNRAAQSRPARGLYVGFTRHTERLDVYCRNSFTYRLFKTFHQCDQGGKLYNACNGLTATETTSIKIGPSFTSRKFDNMTAVDIEGNLVYRRKTKEDKFLEVPNDLTCTVPNDFTISNFLFNQWILPSSQPLDETNGVEIPQSIDQLIHSYVGHHGSSFQDAEDVLIKLSPNCSNLYEPMRDLEYSYLGRNFSGKKFTIQLPDNVSNKMAETLVTAARLRGRTCKASAYSQTLMTILGRYSKKVALLHGKAACEAGDKLYDGVMKVTRNIAQITPEEYANAMASQVDRIAAKKQDQFGIFGDGYANTSKIDFFLKTQVKSDLKPNSHLRGSDDGYTYQLKAGQGVSAQPKPINHVVGAWVTAAERKIVEALDPRVALGYGRSPGEMRNFLKEKLMRNNASTDQVVCCDISEQDTSKGPWTNWFMRRLYRTCGVPEEIIDVIECANINWRIDGPGATLKVKHKYQSGRADTLFANTMMNMGLIMSSMNITNLKMALFQGDDSYLRADSIHLADRHPNLKVERNAVGDFIGYMLGEDDVYLDIPRFAVKLMNRTYGSDTDINDYRTAVYDWLRVFQDPQQLYKGLLLNATRYRSTEEEMAVLFNFMRRFYMGKLIATAHDSDCNYKGEKRHKNPNAVRSIVETTTIGVSERKSTPMHDLYNDMIGLI